MLQNKPCKKCGSIERYKGGQCAPCSRERHKKWRLANPEKERKHCATQARKNPQAATKRKAKWRKNNPEGAKKATIIWRKTNPRKYKASKMVERSVAKKRMPSPHTLNCNRCQKQATGYHHWSYSKKYWFDVLIA